MTRHFDLIRAFASDPRIPFNTWHPVMLAWRLCGAAPFMHWAPGVTRETLSTSVVWC